MVGLGDSFLMAGDNGYHVRCATVTYLYRVTVEYLMEAVMRGEMLVNEREEIFSYIGRNCSVVGRIEPNDVTGSGSFRLLAFIIDQVGVETAVVERFFAIFLCLYEFCLIARKITQPLFNHFRQLFNDIRRVVGAVVDI